MSGLSFKRMKTIDKIEIEEVVYRSLKLDVDKIQEEGAAEYINNEAESENMFDDMASERESNIEGSETEIN